ncbi:MAG: aspartate-semialdehyde dehydrogenase [Verrucomicrobiota bacterium]
MAREYRVAVAGATGAVGQEMLRCLEEREFPVADLKLLASSRSKGREFTFKGEKLKVDELRKDSFEDVDIALFSAGGSRSKEFVPAAVDSGAVVIDNSSAYRMDPDVPLVVPEVNPEDLADHQGIIANPNCTTIIMLVALKPLHDISPIRRVIVSTYQSASGAGAKAMEELRQQAEDVLAGKDAVVNELPHQIAFNLFTHDSPVQDNGYTEEEMKMVNETRKMLHCEDIRICATTVRVPVFRAHAEALNIEQERKVSVEEAEQVLSRAPGVRMVNEPAKSYFPMPIDATGEDEVLVGRVRDDLSCPQGLALFVCGDQLLKGAALNAVQIAEELIRKK